MGEHIVARTARRPRAVGPVQEAPPPIRPGEDSIDRHVARWREWEAIAFDEDIEAVVTRIQRISRYLSTTSKVAVAEVGLDIHEYDTLHALMIRDTPGYATIGDLARSARVSPATMTNRIDGLVRDGLVRRIHSEDDRRRVDVQVTDEGYDRWLRAMRRRGDAEEALFVGVPVTERRRLATQLRRLVLAFERVGEDVP